MFTPEDVRKDTELPWIESVAFHSGNWREIKYKELKEVYWKTNIVIIISISVIMNGLKHRKYQKEVKKAEKELIKEFGNPLHVANEEQIVAEEAATA